MKYWLLTTEYPPFIGGGIGTYCKETAIALSRKGVEVQVFVPSHDTNFYTIQQENECLNIIRFNPDYSKQSGTLGYIANLSLSFAEIVAHFARSSGAPDYIESQEYLGISYFLQQYKLTNILPLGKTIFIITLHSPAFVYLDYNRTPTYQLPEFWIGEMEKSVIISADILISPTDFLKNYLGTLINLHGKSIQVIPNPFSFKRQQTTAAPARSSDTAIYYGKLSAQKGSFNLLENFIRIWEKGYVIKLRIIGDTSIVYCPEFQTMGKIFKRKAAKYIKMGLLQFEKKIPVHRLSTVTSDAHVVLFPSVIDNLPYVVLECLAANKIIVASDSGGHAELIKKGETGYIYSPAANDFEEKLFAALSISTENAATFFENAATMLAQFDPDLILRQKLQLLEEYRSSIQPTRNVTFPFCFQRNFLAKKEDPGTLLSVVIPYYNMGKYLDDCLNSVFCSTYKHLEVLIINDGSTDKQSIEKLSKWKKKENVQIITIENMGVAVARNHGALAAKGRFLAFLDADDTVSSTYYAEATRILTAYHNVFFVGAWAKYFEKKKNTWPTFNPQPPFLLVHNMVNSSSLVYERQAFITSGLNDKSVDYGLEDYESVISMVNHGYNGVVIPKVHFHYRIRSGSMIRSITRAKWLYSYKYIALKHRNLYQEYGPEVANLLNANGPGYLYDNPTINIATGINDRIKRKLEKNIRAIIHRYPRVKSFLLTFLKK